jgi:hypothetical protein
LFNRIVYNSRNYKYKNSTVKKIFITALARSGTTAALNALYSSGKYASLTYKNFPFLLSPRLAHIYSFFQSQSEQVERLHNDGIFISQDSPECLDEVFWVKENPNYYQEPISASREISHTSLDAYSSYLDKITVMQRQNSILIKNNNNHARLLSLANYFIDDLFLVLCREPLQHALSLYRTHVRLSMLQRENKSILKYMDLLGHREFGLHHSPFYYNGNTHLDHCLQEEYSSDTPDYWLNAWIHCYQWVIEKDLAAFNNVHVCTYEKMCSKRTKFFELIDNHFQSDLICTQANLINKNFASDESIFSKRLVCTSRSIYEQIKSIEIK